MSDTKDNLVSTAYIGQAAEQYDVKRFITKQGLLFAKFELEQLEKAMSDIPQGAYVLEIGCGTGRFSQHLAQRGYTVLGTDPSLDMLHVAYSKCASHSNVRFEQQQGANLTFSDSTFDFVFAIRVTNQTESREYAHRMIQEMIRVTKPEGKILIEFVNIDRPFKKKSKNIKLSFKEMSKIAHTNHCRVEQQGGILLFSQTLLNKVPNSLLSFWEILEQVSSRIFWKWTSRGYIVLKKQYSE